jgi:chromosome segregation ATPase
MARRQAPPKPEELIQKLDEKVNEFKEEIGVKLDEQLNSNEVTNSDLNDIKEKQEEENKQLKESVDTLNTKIVAELEQETARCDKAVENSRTELSGLIDEKIDALKGELMETIEKMSEQVAVVEKTNSESLSSLKLSIEEKIENMEKSLKLDIAGITGQMNNESSNNEGTKEQIETLFARIDDINEKMYEFETNKKNNLIFYGVNGEQRETPEKLMMKVLVLLLFVCPTQLQLVISLESKLS